MNDAPIVVGIDGSDHSYDAVAWAIDEAHRRGARLEVVICQPAYADVRAFGAGPSVHGMDPIDLQLTHDRAARVVDDVRQRRGVDARGVDIHIDVHAGRPAEQLLAMSEKAQLIVLGRRGSGGRAHGLLGSVSAAVARHAKCPVVVVP